MKSELQSALSPDTEQIFQNALILSVQLHRYGIQRGIATEDLNAAANADLITVNKKILTSDEYSAIGSADAKIRDWAERRSLRSPFRKGTYMFAPPNTPERATLLEEVDATFEEYRGRRRSFVDAFIGVYLAKVDEAKADLGTFFNRADYHTPEYVRDQFRMVTRWLRISVPTELADISPDIYEREMLKQRKNIEETAEEIQAALREGMKTFVERLVERLTPDEDGRKKKFFDTTLGNVTDFLDSFAARNMTNDVALADLVQKARMVLNGVTTDDVRGNDAVRDMVRTNFEKVDRALDKMVQKKPERRITLLDEEEAIV